MERTARTWNGSPPCDPIITAICLSPNRTRSGAPEWMGGRTCTAFAVDRRTTRPEGSPTAATRRPSSCTSASAPKWSDSTTFPRRTSTIGTKPRAFDALFAAIAVLSPPGGAPLYGEAACNTMRRPRLARATLPGPRAEEPLERDPSGKARRQARPVPARAVAPQPAGGDGRRRDGLPGVHPGDAVPAVLHRDARRPRHALHRPVVRSPPDREPAPGVDTRAVLGTPGGSRRHADHGAAHPVRPDGPLGADVLRQQHLADARSAHPPGSVLGVWHDVGRPRDARLPARSDREDGRRAPGDADSEHRPRAARRRSSGPDDRRPRHVPRDLRTVRHRVRVRPRPVPRHDGDRRHPRPRDRRVAGGAGLGGWPRCSPRRGGGDRPGGGAPANPPRPAPGPAAF